MKQFSFETYVDVYTSTGTLHYVHNRAVSQSLDIEFSLPFDNTSKRSVGEVTIWNMSRTSFNRIHQGDRVVIKAGYHGDIGVIFDGEIYRTTVPTRDGGDYNYILRVVEGRDYEHLKHISLSFSAKTSARTIINKLLSKTGIKLNFVSLGTEYVYKEGYTIDGSPYDALSDVVNQAKSALYYRHGQLTIRNPHDGKKDAIYEINNGTGLISSPVMQRRDEDWFESDDDDKQGRYAYSFDMLLNYRIATGAYVHLHSEFANVYGTVLSGEHSFDGTNPQTTIELGVR